MYNIGYKQRLPVFINSSFNEENKFKVDLSICVCVWPKLPKTFYF